MDHEVALWQRGVENDDDQPDLGPAGYLFEASTTTFSAMLQLLASNSDLLDPGAYQRLRNEFQKFYMWNEGFSTRSGELDYILASSKNLKSTVLGLLVQWVTAVSKVPSTLSEYDWSTIVPALAELEVLAHKADQVAKAVMIDMKSQCFVLRDAKVNYDSDSDSDSISSLSDTTFEDIIEDLSTYMEGLVDLAPSLEHPAADIFIHDTGTGPIDDLSSVPEAARPFVIILKDRFPSIEPVLGRKLGEANWLRRERLRQKLASAPLVDSTPTAFTDDRSDGDTVIAPNNQSAQYLAPSVHSTVRPPSHYQSVTTQSTFSDPSLFDSDSVAAPRYRRNIPVAESVTSFVTSLAEGPEHGQRRIPHLPDNHDFDAPFQCQVCGETQLDIRNRADWKNHVYHDLEPYVCLFTDCNFGILTFRSRREWMEHEFQVHRVVEQWRCNLCNDTFYTQELFRSHIHLAHEEHSAASQNEEVVSAARRVVARNASLETCPFCLTSPAQTQKGFASHVGRHQQEISLAALPNLEMDSEQGESDNSDDNDDDDDDDDDDDGSRSNSSVRTDASNRTLQLRPSDDSPNGPSTGSGNPSGANKDQFGDEHTKEMPSDTQLEEEIQDIPLDLSQFPLHEAAYKGDNKRMATLLASADHDIDQPIGQYGTPLQVASLNGHASVVRCLLNNSANVDVHAGKYGTALQAAAAEGHVEIARSLLDAGASVNKRAGMYRSALQAAASNGQESMFKLLLDRGARTDGVYFPDGKPARRSEDLASNRPALSTSIVSQTSSDSISAERKFTLDKLTAAVPNSDEEIKDRPKPPVTSTPKTDVPLPEDDDDEVYPCKRCGEILEEGKAFELAGNRWHIDCFRCNTCGVLLNSDANLLLLGDGSLICNNCTYSCSSCGEKIEDLAILTGDQAFCATCFRCRNCKKKIENLRYARTSQGIFCMSCHESLMARRRKKSQLAAQAAQSAQTSKNSQLEPYSLDKTLPALPPNFESPESLSDESSRHSIPTSAEPRIGKSLIDQPLKTIDPPPRTVSITHPSLSMRAQSGSIASAEKPEWETEGRYNEASLHPEQSEVTTIAQHTLRGPPSLANNYPGQFSQTETPEKRNRFSARDFLFRRGDRSK